MLSVQDLGRERKILVQTTLAGRGGYRELTFHGGQKRCSVLSVGSLLCMSAVAGTAFKDTVPAPRPPPPACAS